MSRSFNIEIKVRYRNYSMETYYKIFSIPNDFLTKYNSTLGNRKLGTHTHTSNVGSIFSNSITKMHFIKPKTSNYTLTFKNIH